MSQVHAKTVVTADDGVSEVGSDEWNAGHNTSLATSEVELRQRRFLLASTQRLTAASTARLRVVEVQAADSSIRGSFNVGSQDVLNDNWMLQYKRTSLSGSARVSLFGTAELFTFDLAPVGRLVLAGSGG